jgi:hypothetical protein
MKLGFMKVNPRTIKTERRDCAVRASSIATGLPYKVMHDLYRLNGRKNGQGVSIGQVTRTLDYTQCVSTIGASRVLTLKNFISQYKTGRWVVCNNRHAFAVIDGVVYDEAEMVSSRTHVVMAWKVDRLC